MKHSVLSKTKKLTRTLSFNPKFDPKFNPKLRLFCALTASLLAFSPVMVLAEAPAFEGMCRQKAKEVAAESYRGCITENRKIQIETLKNDYQQKLKSLKDEYEGEIKKMSGNSRDQNSHDQNSHSQEAAVNFTPAAPIMNTSPEPPTTPPTRKTTRSAPRPSTLRSLPAKTLNAEEMTVRTRPSTRTESAGEKRADSRIETRTTRQPEAQDDSIMDIPEPIPVEGPSASSNNTGI